MRIAVVGSGYVGLVAAACFAELGHTVVCIDSDAGKIAALKAGRSIIHEDHLQGLLDRHRGVGLSFSTSLTEAVKESLVIVIAVGTPPTASGDADLSYVESVTRAIARSAEGYKLIIEKSTVPVYTSAWIRRVMILNGCSSDAFDVVSNPEFLREGTAVTDFLYPDRIVAGADTERAGATVREIYKPLLDGSYARRSDAVSKPQGNQDMAVYIETSAQSAELIKHASNAFLAMKISFINAVAAVCEAVGANIEDVRKGIGSDTRIGSRFLQAGIGYGGSCFPKDVAAFRSVAKENGCQFGLLDEIHRINEEQRQRFIKKVRTALWTLKGKRLGVLGLAYKDGTDDVRESPAIEIVRRLLDEGCTITAFDPAATERARAVLGDIISYAPDAYTAVQDADALIILTEWKEFATLDLGRIKKLLNYPIVLDGRNLFDPQLMAKAGLNYYSIGREAIEPGDSASLAPRNPRREVSAKP